MLWSEPRIVLRDIPLRRGLNIVWSPASEAAAPEPDASSGSGHGVGKSLFCRLLRYCLGEDTFANTETRDAIAAAFPAGLVGAEVVVAGTPWSVLRPIGMTRRINAAANLTLEELSEVEGKATGIEPLLDAITKILPPGLEEHLPGSREHRIWLLALAWLARDQECRFSGLLDWRHPSSNSGSPAAGLSSEDRATTVRLLLDVVTAAELKDQAHQGALGRQRRGLDRELRFLEHEAERLGSPLFSALSLEPSLLAAASLASEQARAAARSRLSDSESVMAGDDDESHAMKEMRSKLESVTSRLAVAKHQTEQVEAMKDVQEKQAAALRGERATLDAHELKTILGEVCPVCNVPIDRALAQGCGLSHSPFDAAEITTNQRETDAKLERCKQAIADSASTLRELARSRRALEAEATSIGAALQSAREAQQRQRLAHRQAWQAASRLVDEAQRLCTVYSEHQAATDRLAEVGQNEEQVKQQILAHRARHREVLARLNELFGQVCRSLLGEQCEATIGLRGHFWHADLQVGGQAMESLKAIVFDIAALLMSIEGKVALPSLLIHDSPREADLALPLYHRLFRFMSDLEALSTAPPFQYIITTTTEPPPELSVAPFLVLPLGGPTDADRLFRRAL
jgi:hypothetical protein